MRITSASGTDLTLSVTGRAAFGLWGAPDKPGKWDHWSVAVVVGGANREGSNGRLVIDVGDIILGMQRYVTSGIEINIEEGVITRIEGGLDATLLRQWFEKWKDRRAYWISHVGWGCDDRADWNRMASKSPGGIGDAESFSGVFQIAFGRDTSWYIGGGTNDVPAHIDFNCLGHSISLDGVAITEEGNLF
jgi:2,5-dihydroxypyridine 5,6-dioxygenase